MKAPDPVEAGAVVVIIGGGGARWPTGEKPRCGRPLPEVELGAVGGLWAGLGPVRYALLGLEFI